MAHELRLYALTALGALAQHVCLFELRVQQYNPRLIGYILLMTSWRLTAKAAKAARRRPSLVLSGATGWLAALEWTRTLLALWCLLTMFERYSSVLVLFIAY